MKNIIIIVMTAAVILCGPADSAAALPGEVGSAAPEFSLSSYDGRTYGLTDYPDKIVVLIWFDYTCPSVVYQYEQSMTLINLPRKYRDQNVAWLAINSSAEQTTEENQVFAREHGVSYPILDGQDGRGRAFIRRRENAANYHHRHQRQYCL
jgi:peroxiredoxin